VNGTQSLADQLSQLLLRVRQRRFGRQSLLSVGGRKGGCVACQVLLQIAFHSPQFGNETRSLGKVHKSNSSSFLDPDIIADAIDGRPEGK
jgi:hypothetical protein